MQVSHSQKPIGFQSGKESGLYSGLHKSSKSNLKTIPMAMLRLERLILTILSREPYRVRVTRTLPQGCEDLLRITAFVHLLDSIITTEGKVV
jgi:hypothetical protein